MCWNALLGMIKLSQCHRDSLSWGSIEGETGGCLVLRSFSNTVGPLPRWLNTLVIDACPHN